jgi:hypothetical protein
MHIFYLSLAGYCNILTLRKKTTLRSKTHGKGMGLNKLGDWGENDNR